MNIYLRNLISEDERRRISNLHNSKIKSEFKKLLSEQDPNLVQRNDPDLSPEMNKFNEGAFNLEDFIAAAKEQVDGFPEDGYVVNIPTHGMVWGVRTKLQDGTIGVKYYLKQDGTVVGPDMTTISKNKWYTAPIQVKGDTMKTLNPTQVSSKLADTTLQPLGGQPKTALDTQNLATGKELKKQGNLQKRMLKKADKQQRKDDKQAKQNCSKYYQNYSKYSKNMNDSQKLQYESYLNTCCDVLEMNFTGLPFCQTQGTATTKLGTPPTIPKQTQVSQVQDSEIDPNK